MTDVFLSLLSLSLKRLFRVQEMVYERGGGRLIPECCLVLPSLTYGPSFLLQLTCVGVGDVCNKGKVRAAKLFPAVSVGHVGGAYEIRVMSYPESGGGQVAGAFSPGSALAHRILALLF